MQNPKGVVPPQFTERVVNPLGDAAAVRGGGGAVPGALSERPQGASFAHGPLVPCSAREAAGRPRAVAFLW